MSKQETDKIKAEQGSPIEDLPVGDLQQNEIKAGIGDERYVYVFVGTPPGKA